MSKHSKPVSDGVAATDPYLVQLRTRVDQHFQQASSRSPRAFRCAAGCSTCCHRRIDVFEVEAEPIIAALKRLESNDPTLRATIRKQADDPAKADICPLLVRDQCTVYGVRPLICRSHGLPIWVESEHGEGVSVCPLNFENEEIPPESVLRLEALNAPLAVLAELHQPGAPRVSLADLARA